MRALVAEAQAHERKEAPDATRLALRALEATATAQNSTPTAQETVCAAAPSEVGVGASERRVKGQQTNPLGSAGAAYSAKQANNPHQYPNGLADI